MSCLQYLINVSSQVIHMTAHAGVAQRPAYTLSKMAATLLFQVIAQNTPVQKLQVVSFHPGLVFNDAWKAAGLTPDLFDSGQSHFPNFQVCCQVNLLMVAFVLCR